MQVKDIMTRDPACCTPDTNLQEVARLMVECDCGGIPVVDNRQSMKPIGFVTDRDICCRTLAEGENPLEMTAGDCMSTPCVTVTQEMNVEDSCRLMAENQIRRVPVVNENGAFCGIVAQADIARHAPQQRTAEVVREVSRAARASSRAGSRGAGR